MLISTKSSLSTMILLILSISSACAAPAPPAPPAPVSSCHAQVTVTVTIAGPNEHIAQNTGTPKSTFAETNNNAADFGSCSTPEITFADHLDGRKETAFIATNLSSFNHGSADNIGTITNFICNQLVNTCKANAAALDLCSNATAAANAAAEGTGAQADEFNAVFGITTHFADLPVINNVGQTISEGPLTTPTPSNNKGSNTGDDQDQQSATTLNAKVIATGFAQNGQTAQEPGQVASLTSKNNFINFCLTTNLPLTNGQQIKTGSCNPAPMGIIASTNNMPSSKFVFPNNGGKVNANKSFNISMAINNLEAGNFVNAQSNYYAAPQQVNSKGNIIGHTHFVIEKLSSLGQTTPTNPQNFIFFKGVNTGAVNGVVSAPVPSGLPAGAYRLASINAASNHQPALVAVAQHGSLDDMVYFTAA